MHGETILKENDETAPGGSLLDSIIHAFRSSIKAFRFSRNNEDARHNRGDRPRRRLSEVFVNVPRKMLRRSSAPVPAHYCNRHEAVEKKLRHCQEDLEAQKQSVNEIAKHAEAVQEAYSASKLAHEQTSVNAMRAVTVRSNFLDSLNFLDGSMTRLLHDLERPDPDWSLVQAHVKEMREDYEKLQQPASLLRDHDMSLVKLDNAQYREARKFMDEATSLFRSLNLPLPDAASTNLGTADDTASATPSLLTRFLDRRGDIPIFQERLAELERDHIDATLQREVKRDRDEDLSTTDEAFEQDYLNCYDKVVRDLQQAEADTAQLELVCKSRGLEIPVPGNFSDSSSSSGAETDDLPQIDGYVDLGHLRRREAQMNSITTWLPSHVNPGDGEDPEDAHLPRPRRTSDGGWAPPSPSM